MIKFTMPMFSEAQNQWCFISDICEGRKIKKKKKEKTRSPFCAGAGPVRVLQPSAAQ